MQGCRAPRDVNVFIFQKNDRFVMKTTTKIRKRNDRFLKSQFLKRSFFSENETIVFENETKNDRLTINNPTCTQCPPFQAPAVDPIQPTVQNRPKRAGETEKRNTLSLSHIPFEVTYGFLLRKQWRKLSQMNGFKARIMTPPFNYMSGLKGAFVNQRQTSLNFNCSVT